MPNTYNIAHLRSNRRRPARRQITRRRAPVRRRFNRYRRRMAIPRTITPDSRMVKLRYCYTTQLNPGSGATAMEHVKANDLYAPSVGVGQHQPMGFDQMMQLYERFCVVGSKINVAFIINNTGDAADSRPPTAIVGIALRNSSTDESVQDNTATQTNEGLLERNRTQWKYLNSQSNGGAIKTITHKFGLKKFFHLKSINDNVGNLRNYGTAWGHASASPSTQAYYNIFAAPFTDVQDLSLTVRVTVDYTAIFQGRKLLGQS